ncbi:PAS domain-containing protein [Cellulosimicrobium funkei]|nr:PAS domain-containing protein [Cellulosimicrobium funkei]
MSLANPPTQSSAKARSGWRRYAGQYGVWGHVLWPQLTLAISVVFVATALLVFDPDVVTGSLPALVGIGSMLALTAVAGVIPWQRLPSSAYWAIPVLDFIPIALLEASIGNALHGMRLFVAIPVCWLAWSRTRPFLGVGLGFLGTAAVTLWPYLPGAPVLNDESREASLAGPIVVPFIMLALGVASNALSKRLGRQRAELRTALERSRSQNRLLQAVVETSDVGILVVDKDGRDVLINQAQRRLHFIGLAPDVERGAERKLLVFEKDGTTPLAVENRPIARALRGEDFRGQLIAVGTDGAQQHISVSASPLYDEDDFDGSVMVFQNVTDLVEAIRAREQFVAEVSHEFRTPLTSIIGYLDLALEEDLDPALRQFLSTSQRNADRLLGLVTSLLDSAAGTSTVTVQDVDLARLARYSVESATIKAQHNGLKLESELPERFTAVADPVKMGQVVDNLLSNAIKYTPEGGAIRVSLRPLEAVGGGRSWVDLVVEDTGIGMTAMEQSKLFTNFYRTEHVRKAAIPGTGLGLAITQGLVRAHGGEILVSSEKAVGSTFTVRIPIDGPNT